MSSKTPFPPVLPPKRRPLQFGLAGMMIVMLVVGVSMAPAFYFVQASKGAPGKQLVAILLAVTAPMLLMVIASIIVSISRWRNR